MQGIIADSPLRKKPNKEPSPYEDKNEAKDRDVYFNIHFVDTAISLIIISRE